MVLSFFLFFFIHLPFHIFILFIYFNSRHPRYLIRPEQGEAQFNTPSENDDQLNDLINSRFVSFREAQPDDPHIDWCIQVTTRMNIQVEEDLLTDPDEPPEAEVELEPPKSLKAVEDGRPL